jgi:hypothetical protein
VKSDREYRVIREKLIAGMRQKRLPKNIFLCSTRRRKGTEGGAGSDHTVPSRIEVKNVRT